MPDTRRRSTSASRRLTAQFSGAEPPEPSGPIPDTRVVGAQIAR
jgi:hypothetical protein